MDSRKYKSIKATIAIFVAANITMLLEGSSRATGFVRFPQAGAAYDVATDGYNDFVIGTQNNVGNDYPIYVSSGHQPFVLMPGGGLAVHVAVGWGAGGGNSLSVVNSAHESFYYNPSLNSSHGGWAEYPHDDFPLYEIAAYYPRTGTTVGTSSPNDLVSATSSFGPEPTSSEWALGSPYTPADFGYAIYNRTNNGAPSAGWDLVSGDATAISVGGTNVPYVVNSEGDLFQWDATNGYFITDYYWTATTADAMEVAVDSHFNSSGIYDSIWVIDSFDNVWRYQSQSGTAGAFVQVSGLDSGAYRIAAGYDAANDREEVIASDYLGQIWVYEP